MNLRISYIFKTRRRVVASVHAGKIYQLLSVGFGVSDTINRSKKDFVEEFGAGESPFILLP
jgi:hypothetical protein